MNINSRPQFFGLLAGLFLAAGLVFSSFLVTRAWMVIAQSQTISVTGSARKNIRADLIVDSDTVSRYRWSSSKGPPLKIQSGTLATAQITVASRRPIEMVIPLVREYTGL